LIIAIWQEDPFLRPATRFHRVEILEEPRVVLMATASIWRPMIRMLLEEGLPVLVSNGAMLQILGYQDQPVIIQHQVLGLLIAH